jgi:hypothetical protein
MSLAEAMKGHEDRLRQQVKCLDTPVTEVVVFKLKAEATPEALAAIRKDFVLNATAQKEPIRIGWGRSLDDAKTVVMLFDWQKIQHHWDFWQQPEFEPVMASINQWFEPGTPNVHHYLFKPPGMVETNFVRVSVWDNQEEATAEDLVASVSQTQGKLLRTQAGFAVDPDAATKCCVLVGFEDEEAARSHDFVTKQETHLVRPEFLGNSVN